MNTKTKESSTEKARMHLEFCGDPSRKRENVRYMIHHVMSVSCHVISYHKAELLTFECQDDGQEKEK